MKDANQADPSSAVVRSVEFHPSGNLLLTASLDKRVRFFQVRAWLCCFGVGLLHPGGRVRAETGES